MDKIYSRRRILIPQFIGSAGWKLPSNPDKKKRTKFMKIGTIFTIAIITAKIVLQAISPIIDEQCENLAKSIATKISNEQATNVMSLPI